MRDRDDNCIIICSIENLDPMGVHTGDSITVAPAQTLTDKEYQRMRDASIAVLREIGVETGGSQHPVRASIPTDGRMIVIEMNPRVSRSSALASKATGFPIAKIAAKLAVGYTLDELQNDITGGARRPASSRPSTTWSRRFRASPSRNSPAPNADADHADEVGRRGDGHRPHVPGVAAEGAARPGNRRWTASTASPSCRWPARMPRRRWPTSCAMPGAESPAATWPMRSGRAGRSSASSSSARSIPGSWRRSADLVREEAAVHRTAVCRRSTPIAAARAQAQGLLRSRGWRA